MTRQPARQIPVVAAALVVGLLIGWLVLGGGDDEPTAARTATMPSPATPEEVRTTPTAYPQLGLRFARPAGWKSSIRRGALDVATADRAMSVAVSMLPGHPSARDIRGSDRAELARIFHAHEIGRQRSRVGKLGTIVTELVGKTSSQHPVRILSMAVSSPYRTYSVQVFTVLKPQRPRLYELQALLGSFEFPEPT